MILAIDVGNTNIVIGCIDDEKIYFVSRLDTNCNKTADEYSMDFKNILKLYDIPSNTLDGCIISSVVPPLMGIHLKAVKKAIGKTPIFVDPSMNHSFEVKIDNPNLLGSDLLVAATAALQKYPVPMVIVDMGTATTLSIIDNNKAFIGGIIYPGIQISMETLSQKTSQLPSVNLEEPNGVICKNTVDAMKSGIIYGSASMLDGLISRIKKEFSEDITVIATGGLAPTIVPYCESDIICDDNLILKGLLMLYKQVR